MIGREVKVTSEISANGFTCQPSVVEEDRPHPLQAPCLQSLQGAAFSWVGVAWRTWRTMTGGHRGLAGGAGGGAGGVGCT